MKPVSQAIADSTLLRLVSGAQRLSAAFPSMESGRAVYMLVDLSLRAGFLIGAASATGNTEFVAQVDHVYEYIRTIEQKLIERLR